MKISLSVLLMAIILISESFSQTKDVTKTFTNWYGESAWTYKPEGATIDSNGVIHLSLLVDDYRTLAYMIDSGIKDKLRARKSMVCYALFFHAQDVFKELRTANEYNVWAIYYPIERDRYGNQVSRHREVIAHLRLTRETAQRINWDYLVNTLWVLADYNYDTAAILQMLDFYYFNPDYFH